MALHYLYIADQEAIHDKCLDVMPHIGISKAEEKLWRFVYRL